MRGSLAFVVACSLSFLAACGNKNSENPDGPPPAPDMRTNTCGNEVIEPPEDCDDGNTQTDAICTEDCRFTCGNGALDDTFGELCDPGIAAGNPGACPADCDDQMACTSDVLSGSDCAVECLHADITVPADGDGCCPPGENANTDNDCIADCMNGVVEGGELCDQGIAAGDPGACPTDCDDSQACTTDMLSGGGTCQAMCTNTPITMPINNDGCCAGTPMNDNDCMGCGDGVVTPPETCDTAIMMGTGACPTACNDMMACTTDMLLSPGTCSAACSFTPITAIGPNDGCCPPGGNANTDPNCMPVCGNGVMEMGEACDDGNTNNNDSCNNMCQTVVVPTAYRFTDLDIRDPHLYTSVFICLDVTGTVNGLLQDSVTMDADSPPDGFYDLSPVLVFRPLNQGGVSTPMEVHFADCGTAAPMACTGGGAPPDVSGTATNMATGTCLGSIAGTLSSQHSPAPTPATGPCFSSNAATITIDVGGIPITLRDAQVGATYVGNPAGSLTNGLLRGFITETDANNTIIPSDIMVVGGMPLSALLPGGSGNCASHNAKDTHMGMTGWWFYLNFPAAQRPWTD
jgi:cysteine-rich repeat protein